MAHIVEAGWTQDLAQKRLDIKLSQSLKADLSESNLLLDVFLQKSEHLRRITAAMGFAGSDADDILQNVSIKVLNQNQKDIDDDKVLGWLIRVTVNECIAEHRRKKRFRRTAENMLQHHLKHTKQPPTPPDDAIRAEEVEMMRKALQKLDYSILTPLALRYFCDYDAAQIARFLEMNPSTVRSRLRDARLCLAKVLTKLR